ncbi:FAD-dependent monooxygenase [Actinocrispum wychmicini]|uniref:2-polyprenyl-6-methoxyphenol hydroxylase-like FAD-dependent oxidoreductase n=1 Tax=Actinocrispum wychmicini TaxID=1213861 RepID=A0A4R2IPB1_9PSEU|nr:FAD-dependent monooxygenase [Actinocrispum wychmicini]TCO46757.1 2-polyprenyl-6-methoxyphenol hydroxylase-like FAD-dependent oxidoreductase [Actinocrispum wychmicini]
MSGQRTPEVLVVGGGLVGLTAALVLRHHGVPVTVVERRETTSPQPKARRFHVRTMEIFREMGLAGLVHEAARDLAGHDHMAAGRTLAEAEQLPLWQPTGVSAVEVSPELPCLIAQDVLEPVLRAAAVEAGAEVRFSTELLGFEQTTDGVVGRLAGEEIHAQYLIAADGAHSGVRDALGITRSGQGAVGEPNVNVYFYADLASVVRGREFNLCRIDHPDIPGGLASVDGRRRWVFMTPGADTDRDWPTLVRTALGVPAPDLEVRSVLPWQAEMLVADHYSAGRVHLAGDAAHVMPPYAASGANTGIADVHNLGWKLAAVLRGEAAPSLLASYHAERRPAGWFVADQSTRRAESFTLGTPDPTLAHPFVLAAGGFQYTEGALVPDGSEEPILEFAPAGRVGTRIPHRWLDDSRSTVDLAGPDWATVTGDQVDFLSDDECLLVRPDDIVAWRGASTAEATKVRDALLTA